MLLAQIAGVLGASFPAPLNAFLDWQFHAATSTLAALIFWSGSTVLWHIVLGRGEYYATAIAFACFPFMLFVGVFPSFALELKRAFSWLSSRTPKIALFYSLFLAAIWIAFSADNPLLLKGAMWSLFTLVIVNFIACAFWTFRPLSFLDRIRSVGDLLLGSVKNDIQKKLEDKGLNEEMSKQVAGTVENYTKALGSFALLTSKLNSPVLLFMIFLCFLCGTLANCVLAFAGIYRITHHLSGDALFSGFAFGGHAKDFVYIAAMRLVNFDPVGVTVNNGSASWVFVAQALLSLALLAGIVTAYSTVTQAKADTQVQVAVDDIKKLGEDIASHVKTSLYEKLNRHERRAVNKTTGMDIRKEGPSVDQ